MLGISVSVLPRSVHVPVSGLFQITLLPTVLFILIRCVSPQPVLNEKRTTLWKVCTGLYGLHLVPIAR